MILYTLCREREGKNERENMFAILGLSEGLKGKQKRKKERE
jgi:hypothetical protein